MKNAIVKNFIKPALALLLFVGSFAYSEGGGHANDSMHGQNIDEKPMEHNVGAGVAGEKTNVHNDHAAGKKNAHSAHVAQGKEGEVNILEAGGNTNHRSATQAIVQNELEEVGIKEKVGTYLNGSLKFIDHTGREVALGDYFDGKKPVVLSFMYYTCPSICQYVVNAQKQAMLKTGMQIGEDYRALSISFDKNDTTEDGAAWQQRYASGFTGVEGAPVEWSFLTGSASAVDQITSQLGFQFKWVESQGEFAHSAAIYVITPEKMVSRYFYGLSFSPFDLKMALAEAKAEEYRSSIERVLLYCYRYDEGERGYVADAWRIMRVGGAFTAFSIATFLFLMIRMERGRRDEQIAIGERAKQLAKDKNKKDIKKA